MKLTKYSHACLVLEKDSGALVIDPGGWSQDFVVPQNVVGVVITHEHQDHLDEVNLDKIVSANPDVVLYAHADVIAKLGKYKTQAVATGENVHVGDFALDFFGGEHATIHGSFPSVANLGVIVDGTLYYPGDSFSLPGREIIVLAVPAAAPWMKMSEAMDFLAEVKPQRAFPTHDAILSEAGQSLSDMLLGSVAEKAGTTYQRLSSGESIDL
jgi:L-ascorbate metabolism protein UlaG (beta-lactamase superfamily)